MSLSYQNKLPMAAPNQAVTLLDHIHVAPPPATTSTTTLPFTLLDVIWARAPNINRVTFYEFPYSETHFIQTIIPNLKHSLSQTLKYFYMLAGKLVLPPDSSTMPELHYEEGDAVSLVFARANESLDFNRLVANEPRNCGDFYPLVPHIVLEPSDFNSKVISLLSLQVTLFPNLGVSIGVTNHHAAGDANAIFRFVKAWATLSRDGGVTLSGELMPLYDRTLIKDPKGLGKRSWDLMSTLNFNEVSSKRLPTTTQNVLGTFVFDSKAVQNLKNFVLSKSPAVERLSTFVVVCAYIWTCVVKSRVATEENVDDDEAECFGFMGDCRARLDPPVPDNYFGNCLVSCVVTAKVKELIEGGGFVLAVELIAKSIKEKMFSKDGVLSDTENRLNKVSNMDMMKRMIGVAGSPKYNYYNLDFGFGLARKFEFITIGEGGAIALSGCRDGGGTVEVGLSFPKGKMDAFIACFNEGLKALHL